MGSFELAKWGQDVQGAHREMDTETEMNERQWVLDVASDRMRYAMAWLEVADTPSQVHGRRLTMFSRPVLYNILIGQCLAMLSWLVPYNILVGQCLAMK